MPPFIIGILQQETPVSYLLSNVLEQVADGDSFRLVERKFPDYISRTYVYRTELLGVKPDLDSYEEPLDYGGGMG
jgi:hypothetical protein